MTHYCKQERRIAKAEAEMSGHTSEIKNLVKRLDSLTKGIWALVLVLIPTVLGLFGFLIWQTLVQINSGV